MRSYHSHIFASGIVVTHSHPIEDTNQTNSGANQCEGQLIIFHGLMQDAPDDTQFSAFILPLSYFVTTIDFPSESGFAIWEKELRMGRAPPVPG